MKIYQKLPIFLLSCLFLCGCGEAGAKSISPSTIYGVTTLISFLAAVFYCTTSKRKEIWFMLMFVSVFVVNTGYLALSVSTSLSEALLANRIAYFGQVFLPFSMFMSILDTIQIRYRRWIPPILLVLSLVVFVIAASPGYLDIYYKEVTIERINEFTVLRKVYGPWHFIYMVYLLSYSFTMILVVFGAIRKKIIKSALNSIVILIAVWINVLVWLLEQFIQIELEMLAISYIVSELFLLALHFLQQENEKLRIQISQQNLIAKEHPIYENVPSAQTATHTQRQPIYTPEQLQLFQQQMQELTRTEHLIFESYIAGKTTKEILCELNIKENTLKFHNKNLYSKLGVSSRRQLIEMHTQLQNQPSDTDSEQ